MELTGLPLGTVLAVLGAAGGAVVVLYLLKLRRREVTVPFVRLWQQVLAEKQTTRLFSHLKRLISLLVSLLIVALIALALGDPRYAGATATGRTLVVLVDASASMQATDVSPSRLEEAKREVKSLIDGLGPADRMLVAQMDSSTRPVTPLTGESRVLEDALETIEPTDIAADLERGIRFALDVLRGQPRPEIVVVSDGALEKARDAEGHLRASHTRLSYIKIGHGRRNVAITAFSVRRYPLDKSRSEVLVELWNTSNRSESVELTLLGDGATIDIQRLVLHKNERTSRFFENLSGADRTLEARLRLGGGGHDDLPADDRAYARLPERRRARVLSVSAGNRYLEAALLLDEYLDVTEVAPGGYASAVSSGARYDAIVFDAFVPPSPPASNAIYLFPRAAEGAWAPLDVEGTVARPYFNEIDRRHPVVRWTALDNVNIAEGLQVRVQPGDKVIGGDRGVPLLVAGTRANKRFVAFAFDERRSDLPLRVAWPLLLLNSIDWFVEEDTGYISSYRTGETWHVPVPSSAQSATIVAPDGSSREVPVADGRAVYAGTRAGFYKVRAAGTESIVAANLGPSDEPRIAPVARVEVAGRAAGHVTRGRIGVRRDLWIYLVLAAAAILAIEWFTYHRRWTV